MYLSFRLVLVSLFLTLATEALVELKYFECYRFRGNSITAFDENRNGPIL